MRKAHLDTWTLVGPTLIHFSTSNPCNEDLNLDTSVSLFSECTIYESLISTETKSYHVASTCTNHILVTSTNQSYTSQYLTRRHMEEQVYSTQ